MPCADGGGGGTLTIGILRRMIIGNQQKSKIQLDFMSNYVLYWSSACFLYFMIVWLEPY